MRTICRSDISMYEEQLRKEEKAEGTLRLYIWCFTDFVNKMQGRDYTKDNIMLFKQMLTGEFRGPATINIHLAAVNHFLQINSMGDCRVRVLNIRREYFGSSRKELSEEEYSRLLAAAREKKRERLFMILVTLTTTGVRLSELGCFTVEGVKSGSVLTGDKGKGRQIPLPEKLCDELLEYCEKKGISSGNIFITRSGEQVDRRNLLREMKKMAQYAGIPKEKVSAHNLRHLFTVNYYSIDYSVGNLFASYSGSEWTLPAEHKRLVQ